MIVNRLGIFSQLLFFFLLFNFKGQSTDILLNELTVSSKNFIKNRPPMNGNPGFFRRLAGEKKSKN